MKLRSRSGDACLTDLYPCDQCGDQILCTYVYKYCVLVSLMVLNATFNNISVISWWSVLLVEETGGSGENH